MLTDARIRNAEKKDKNYKLTDAGGLYLFVSTAGSKRWRLKYRFGDKEQLLSLGSYPEVSLKEARQKRDEARAQLKQGKDPGAPARQARLLAGQSGNLTFESLAHEWHSIRKDTWKPVHANDVITSLQRDVFPALGSFLVTDITEPMVLAVLQKVERRGAIETAARLRQRISAVFTYAQAKGAGNRDPAEKLKIAMKRVPKAKRRPALVTIPELQRLIREVESAGAHPLTLLASRFIALTAQRQGNVRHMRWEQIEGVDFLDPLKDASAAIWRIPASEMKQDQDQRGDADFDHIVPLAPAAVEVLMAQNRFPLRR